MSTIFLAILITAAAMAAMALGVLLGRAPLRSGCHCLADAGGMLGNCESCPWRDARNGSAAVTATNVGFSFVESHEDEKSHELGTHSK